MPRFSPTCGDVSPPTPHRTSLPTRSSLPGATSMLSHQHRCHGSFELLRSRSVTLDGSRPDRRLGVYSRKRRARRRPSDEVTRVDHWASAFRELSEADKEVLRLVAWEGVSPAEGASSSSVRWHVQGPAASARGVDWSDSLDKDEAGSAPHDAAQITLVARQAIRRSCISAPDQAAVFADLHTERFRRSAREALIGHRRTLASQPTSL